MKAIHTKTQEQSDRVLEIFESKGWEWTGGRKPTEGKDNWEEYKENTCIRYKNYFGYSCLEYYKKNGYEIVSFEEFLKEEGQLEIKPGDLVGVSDISQEKADEDFRDDADRYYIGKNRKGLYVVEDEFGYLNKCKYISNTLPKEETKTEISLQEIADKFGIDKNKLLIKE